MKKLIVAVMAVLLLLCNITAYADDTTYTEGTLYYKVNDGSIAITGCFGKDETIEIPSQIAGIPVNTIAKGAFIGNENIKTVILPDTITSIEEGAFDAGITVVQKQAVSSASNPEETATPTATPVPESTASPTATPKASPTATPKAAATPTANPTKSPAATSTPKPSSTATPAATATAGSTVNNYETIIIQSGNTSSATSEASTNGAVDEADVYLDEEELEESAAETETKAESSAEEAATEDGAVASGTAVAENEKASTSPAPLIIIGVLAAAAAAGAVIVLKKKNNK